MAALHRLAVTLAQLLLAGTAAANPNIQIRVVGTAVLQARASPWNEETISIQGLLEDEKREPLATETIGILAHGPLGQYRSCDADGGSRNPTDGHKTKVTTDREGRFCVLWASATESAAESFTLTFDGSPNFAAVSTTARLDRSRKDVFLRFAPPPRQLSVEDGMHAVRVDTRAGEATEPSNLQETLSLELIVQDQDGSHASRLARTDVRPGESARFQFDGRALREAGPGLLVARTPGTTGLKAAETSAPILRTARVSVVLAHRSEVPLDYEAPILVAVVALTGAKPQGAIELDLPNLPAVTVSITNGRASLTAPRRHPFKETVNATLRYLPSNAAWIAPDPIPISFSIPQPSPWRQVPWILAAAMVLGWLARSWRRPSATRKQRPPRDAATIGVPTLQQVSRSGAHDGWSGVVLDAHDGKPIGSASIQIVAPSFSASAMSCSATTAPDGTFQLKHTERREGMTLLVTAPVHASFERPIPPPGTLTISLVTYRRHLLESLTTWAKRRPMPWKFRLEPTPSDIRQQAQSLRVGAVERWARAVEAIAYSPEPADSRSADSVEALASNVRGNSKGTVDS